MNANISNLVNLITQINITKQREYCLWLQKLLKSSQVNFRLMAEYNISVSRLTKLHSSFTSNGVIELILHGRYETVLDFPVNPFRHARAKERFRYQSITNVSELNLDARLAHDLRQ